MKRTPSLRGRFSPVEAAFKGAMASSQGKANAAPAPLRSVRRDKGVDWV
ncbi:MAG: hypothetical protein ACPHRA_13360 [Limisphaerales bacterium]